MAVVDELERLAALHKDGVLTDEEFAAQKANVLSAQNNGNFGANYSKDNSEKEKKGIGFLGFVLLIVVIGFVIFMAIGFTIGDTEEARNKQNSRSAISLCWKDYERKSLSVGDKLIVARICEGLERKFKEKYGHNP